MIRKRDPEPETAVLTLEVTSAAFRSNQPVPRQYTGDGVDKSPPIAWSNLPENTKSIAILCDDPDAPTPEPWVHWTIYNIPPSLKGLPEGVSTSTAPREVPGAVQGLNDFGRIGYGGPAPPRGHGTHHYHFKVYALDTVLNIPDTVTKKKLLDAMHGHILAMGELIGTYER